MGGGPFYPSANGVLQDYKLHVKNTDNGLLPDSALFMDPLSFVASVVAVVTLAGTISKELSHLCRALRDAPAEIHALNNEIVDLQAILHAFQEVADTAGNEDEGQNAAKPTLKKASLKAPSAMVTVHLDQAKEKLFELSLLIQKCMAKGNSSRFNTIWLRERPKARVLQRELHNIRRNLQTALLLVNSMRSARIELVLQEVLLGQEHISNDLVQSLQNMTLRNQSPERQDGLITPTLSHDAKNESNSSSPGRTTETLGISAKMDAVEVRTSFAGSRSNGGHCKKWCSCVCHKQNHLKFSAPLTYVLGSLFVGYSGLPVTTPPCNEHSCLRRAIPSLQFSYYFPKWFLTRSVLMSLKVVPLIGPELILRTPRLIRWTTNEASLFHSARAGDIGAIQSMFHDGTVTPFDVTLSLGESALFFAASSGQFKTCKFLLDAGADAQLANKYQITPIECAWQWILNGRLDPATAYDVQAMFDDGSFLETRQFSVIHKIVLGLLPLKDLEAELQASTSTINDVDSGGRTALSWAAERADAKAVELLLSFGAETACPDNSGAYPLHFASIAKDPTALQTLILHGAQIDCRNALGHTPLHWASQSQHDDIFLLPLLLARADINAGDYEGETALMYAGRNERTEIAASLLSHGANVNARTIWGLTALDLCVRYNCHQMLNFLLQHGADYQSTDIYGHTLLHQAVSDGDAQTVATLVDAGMSGVSMDQRNSLGKTAWDVLAERGDVEITKLFEVLRS